MDRWSQIELFVKVAELGSISRAADALKMSHAAASRLLKSLEDRLGARLIERTTRRLWLTEAGREYQSRCTGLLAEMEGADAAVRAATVDLKGLLRLTCSAPFAVVHIAPALLEFRQLYPNLTVEVVAANRYLNFIEAGIDVAIRTREHEPDSGITVRRLAETWRVLAAAPRYLAAHGMPNAPEAIEHHHMLVYNNRNEPFALRFQRGEERRDIHVKASLAANDGQIIREAGLSGLGIVFQPLHIIYDDIAAGRLVVVMPEWRLPSMVINLAYQSRQHQPAKIKVFTQFLTERFAKLNLEQKWAGVLAPESIRPSNS